MPLNKKTLIIIVVALILAIAGGFLGYRQYREQKDNAAKAKCLEETAKMTDEQLVDKINDLSARSPGSQQLIEVRRQMTRYLFCKFSISDKSEGIYEEIKTLLEKLAISVPETKESTIKNLTDYYFTAKKDNTVAFRDSLIGMLATGDLDEICPDKLPDVCTKTVSDFAKQNNINTAIVNNCKNACNLLIQFSEDKDKLEKEVINFKEWDSNPLKQRMQYYSRHAIAYRFGGREMALKVCNNLTTISDKEDCIGRVNILISDVERIEAKDKKCVGQRKDLENLICSVSE